MPSLMIQSDRPFRVFCNNCNRWVASERLNLDGTHDADESQPVPVAPKGPRNTPTAHTVWDGKPKPPEPAPAPREELTYTCDIVWGDTMVGRPNVYTYRFNTGTVYVKTETKNIVTGTFTTTVTVEYPTAPGVKKKTTQRQLKDAIGRAKPASQVRDH